MGGVLGGLTNFDDYRFRFDAIERLTSRSCAKQDWEPSALMQGLATVISYCPTRLVALFSERPLEQENLVTDYLELKTSRRQR